MIPGVLTEPHWPDFKFLFSRVRTSFNQCDDPLRGGHESVGAEALSTQWAAHEEKAWRTSGGLKYVARLSDPPSEILWNLRADPLELQDLSSAHPDEVAALREEALAFFASAPEEWAARARRDAAQAPGDLPPAVLESLKSLGYVE